VHALQALSLHTQKPKRLRTQHHWRTNSPGKQAAQISSSLQIKHSMAMILPCQVWQLQLLQQHQQQQHSWTPSPHLSWARHMAESMDRPSLQHTRMLSVRNLMPERPPHSIKLVLVLLLLLSPQLQTDRFPTASQLVSVWLEKSKMGDHQEQQQR